MKAYALCLSLLTLSALWVEPAAAVDVSAELGAVSDYRYRGFSLSDGKPAVQASITFEHDSGAYASVWTSTIEESGFDADLELDLTAGYALGVTRDLSLDLSATYYIYPSEPASNYVEATAALERSKGPTTLTAGFSFVPEQRGSRDDHGSKRRNAYWFAGASYELSKIPLTLGARLGRERGIFDEVEHGGKWDWCLDASVKLDPFRMGVAYSGTNAGKDALVASLFVDL